MTSREIDKILEEVTLKIPYAPANYPYRFAKKCIEAALEEQKKKESASESNTVKVPHG